MALDSPHDAGKSPLGARLPHESALRHVTGEAVYVDDMPHPLGLLHAMIWPSRWARARIERIEKRSALTVPGVHAVLTADDIPGKNNVGPVFHDEPVLAAGEVWCKGQPVAVVIAETREACREAVARLVVKATELPAVLGIERALAAESFHGTPHVVRRGDPEGQLQGAPHRLQGEVENGGQEHFYLETHAALCVPGEDGHLRVYSSTQHPSEVQAHVAHALARGRHDVVVTCPRMGGAFGGKETQAAGIAVLAALGTHHTARPVKCWLDRDTDMTVTGRRHPFRSTYDVGFDDEGRILGLSVDLVSDGGWAADLSLAIVDRAVFHVDNAYWLPHVHIRARVAKTNTTSNTAFRGFGGPQGMAVIENVMERVAAHLGRDPLEVRRINFYGGDHDHTPYGQQVKDFRIPRMVDELVERADLHRRRALVEAFNQSHRWRKRGLALTPVKFGISFTASFLNQAGAYVVLYSDGTAQLNHGGTEMGQGLYTKMLAVCAHALGIPLGRVRHMPTSTDKVPNTSATAASSGADLNGQAVHAACRQLVDRLRPVAADLLGVDPTAVTLAAETHQRPVLDGAPAWAWSDDGRMLSLAEVAGAAYLRQIPMAAAGFYATPDIGYDRARGHGKPFHYFAYGVGLSEVELDGLTGEWKLLRADLLHDVGDSLSHDIDVGQVEGAFAQGLGWLTMEELVFDADGGLLSHSPSTYKIPAVGDIPRALHVHLLERAPQDDVIYGSKAVGEPPFNLAIGTHVALSRAASAFGTPVQVPMPATTEALLFAVQRARGA